MVCNGVNDEFKIPSEEEIRRKANELGVPIFILQMNCMWKLYMPDEINSSQNIENNKCRFYVTLLFHQEKKYFARIVPENGCNCQKYPPQITKRTYP